MQGFKDVANVFHVQHELGWRVMRRTPKYWQPLLPAPPAAKQERDDA